MRRPRSPSPSPCPCPRFAGGIWVLFCGERHRGGAPPVPARGRGVDFHERLRRLGVLRGVDHLKPPPSAPAPARRRGGIEQWMQGQEVQNDTGRSFWPTKPFRWTIPTGLARCPLSWTTHPKLWPASPATSRWPSSTCGALPSSTLRQQAWPAGREPTPSW